MTDVAATCPSLMATFQTLPGFRDFYPEDLAKRTHVFRLWRQTAATFGFAEYDTPVLEPLDLYRAKSGDEIEGQLFAFTDKGGREVALRPEMTPSVCRLVGARANALKRPIKWFSIGEFYRYERMQKGRGRCFYQLNADVFGEAGPEAEIELIALLIQCMRAFGLTEKDFCVRLSDRNLWFHYLSGAGPRRAEDPLPARGRRQVRAERPRRLQGATRRPSGRSPRASRSASSTFLAIRSFAALETALGPADSAAAGRLAEWRNAARRPGRDGPRRLRPGRPRGRPRARLLHGLCLRGLRPQGRAAGARRAAVATTTSWASSAGPDLPAVGFAIGDMTFSLLLEERGLVARPSPGARRLLRHRRRGRAQGGLRRHPAGCAAAGYRVDYPMKELAFGKQFKAAADSGARIALIYGGDELARGVVKMRDLADRTERDFPSSEVEAAVRGFFEGR